MTALSSSPERVLAALDGDASLLEVQGIEPHGDRLAHPEAVAADQEDEGVVTDAVATRLGGVQQAINLVWGDRESLARS